MCRCAHVLKFFRRWFGKKPKVTALFLPRERFAGRIRSALTDAGTRREEIAARLEEVLIGADTGPAATSRLITAAFQNTADPSPEAVLTALKNTLVATLSPKNSFAIDGARKPFVIYLVGVNGVGKTTTAGKLARIFKTQGLGVTLVAADTFRAAAVEQLKIWADRNAVGFVSGAPDADPASVIVNGVRSACANNTDVVIVDTAGRLHTKSNLMEELKKMARIGERELKRRPDEIWLVLDAITGQNGFNQAKVFLDAVPVSGIILTKYDATAKGGVIVAITEETGLPVRFLGLGEKAEDLRRFVPKEFVERLFGS